MVKKAKIPNYLEKKIASLSRADIRDNLRAATMVWTNGAVDQLASYILHLEQQLNSCCKDWDDRH